MFLLRTQIMWRSTLVSPTFVQNLHPNSSIGNNKNVCSGPVIPNRISCEFLQHILECCRISTKVTKCSASQKRLWYTALYYEPKKCKFDSTFRNPSAHKLNIRCWWNWPLRLERDEFGKTFSKSICCLFGKWKRNLSSFLFCCRIVFLLLF